MAPSRQFHPRFVPYNPPDEDRIKRETPKPTPLQLWRIGDEILVRVPNHHAVDLMDQVISDAEVPSHIVRPAEENADFRR